MIKRFSVIFLFSVLNLNNVFSLFNYGNIGGVSESLGGCGIASVDVWGARNNPSSIVFMQEPAVGLAYREQFGLKELAVKSLVGILPANDFGSLGMVVTHIGDEVYSNFQASVCYSKYLATNFAMGIAFEYCGVSVLADEKAINTGVFTGTLGVFWKIAENLSLAGYCYNPFAVSISDKNIEENISVCVRVGMNYSVTPIVHLLVELEKENNTAVRVKSGASGELVKNLNVRFGVSSQPISYSFGFGYRLDNFVFDIAFLKHRYLGCTPSVGLSYLFEK